MNAPDFIFDSTDCRDKIKRHCSEYQIKIIFVITSPST